MQKLSILISCFSVFLMVTIRNLMVTMKSRGNRELDEIIKRCASVFPRIYEECEFSLDEVDVYARKV